MHDDIILYLLVSYEATCYKAREDTTQSPVSKGVNCTRRYMGRMNNSPATPEYYLVMYVGPHQRTHAHII